MSSAVSDAATAARAATVDAGSHRAAAGAFDAASSATGAHAAAVTGFLDNLPSVWLGAVREATRVSGALLRAGEATLEAWPWVVAAALLVLLVPADGRALRVLLAGVLASFGVQTLAASQLPVVDVGAAGAQTGSAAATGVAAVTDGTEGAAAVLNALLTGTVDGVSAGDTLAVLQAPALSSGFSEFLPEADPAFALDVTDASVDGRLAYAGVALLAVALSLATVSLGRLCCGGRRESAAGARGHVGDARQRRRSSCGSRGSGGAELTEKSIAAMSERGEDATGAGGGAGGAGGASGGSTRSPRHRRTGSASSLGSGSTENELGEAPEVAGAGDEEGIGRGPDTEGDHCYSSLSASVFPVRSATYLEDSVKTPSGPSIFTMVHTALFESEGKVDHLAAMSSMYLTKARARGDRRFYLIIVYQVPGSPRRVHLALYFAATKAQLRSNTRVYALWQRFLTGDDAYRNSRWKVIPAIAEGNWIVKKSVGTKPALLGTKLDHEWIQGPNYLECDVDVASSSMASMLTGLLQQYARYLVIDLGFTLQGEEHDELPEQCLGTVRLSRLDLERAIDVRPLKTLLTRAHGHSTEADENQSDS